MRFGMIGLGRMGASWTLQLLRGGHECVAYDRDPDKVSLVSSRGAVRARSIADLTDNLQPPRVIWLMLPAGEPTVDAMIELAGRLRPGDIAVDSGNSRYQDDIVRRDRLEERGIEFVDCGTSGNSQMLGGRKEMVDYVDPLLQTLSPTPDTGYLYCGSSGAGHFVRMAYARIESGGLESFAGGFDVLSHSDTFGYELPVPEITRIWRRSSGIWGLLYDVATRALGDHYSMVAQQHPGPVATPVQVGVSSPEVTRDLRARLHSQSNHTFAEQMLSGMRLALGEKVENSDLQTK
jgi:6-phosphogluconate dehydrogenase